MHLRKAIPCAQAICLIAFVLLPGEPRPPATDALRKLPGRGDVAVHGLTPDWWAAAQADLAAREYHASESAGSLQAPNRAQGFRTRYHAQAVELAPRDETAAAWTFSWRTTRFGRPGAMADAQAVPPRAQGTRVSYLRRQFVEWYENRPQGLEQGFLIPEPPPGRGPIAIEGAIGGSLALAFDRVEEAATLLDDDRECVLRYAGLHVWDANGRELPAWLATADRALTIHLDDAGATYPVYVDPILQTPSWTGEPNQGSAQFGISVSTAGDVNRDGYSDVIVGAINYDNGQTDEGRAFVYHGSPTGLSLTPNWTAESNQMNAHMGLGVGAAGDVNGDGFGDVVVGAFNYDNGQTDEGRAYLYLGAAGGLATTPAWTAEANQMEAAFGRVVGTAGDVNGDGFADVIVAAHLYDNGQPNEGRAFVYHGSAAGLGAAPAFTCESNQANSNFAVSVSTAGDVNADGYSDVVVGANLFSNNDGAEGRIFVFPGSATGLTATPWTAESNVNLSYFGFAVAGVGDVNGDSYADVAVGSPLYGNGQAQEGRSYVFYGSRNGIFADSDWQYEPNETNAQWGFSLSTAGDVNADGYADILIGAPFSSNGETGEGLAAIMKGTPSGPTPFWGTWSEQINARFGIAVGTAGDVNGDGLSDVIVGADFFDNGQTDEGRAMVFHGSLFGPGSEPGWTAESNQNLASLRTIAGAGDINADGYSDVVAGVPNYDHGEDEEGALLVFLGSKDGLATLPNVTLESDIFQGQFGAAVEAAGDVNGDGYSDVLVGAIMYPLQLRGQPGSGKAFLYEGSPTGLIVTPAWTAEVEQEGTQFGATLDGAGDVNGDGFADVIVGAGLYSHGESQEGRAFLYEGSPSGLQATPAWTAESNQITALFASSVAGAGDVNGDGYSDVLVAAPGYDNGQNDEGRAYLYEGSPTGLHSTPAWTFEGNLNSAFVGEVATAGDVNGDGYSDVLVGAYGWTNGETFEGRAWLFEGGPSGLATVPSWSVESDVQSALLGSAVSTAGDPNGDGFSDVMIGAPGYSGTLSNQGRVSIYYGSAAGLAPTSTWDLEGDQPRADLGSAVALAGDVNGDGFSDITMTAGGYSNPELEEGRALLFYGNDGPGLARIPRQAQPNDSAPIDLLGRSTSQNAFRVKALGRTPAGRGNVRLEVEAKPAGTPFDGLGLVVSPWTNTGPSVQFESAVLLSLLPGGPLTGDLYHWRVRTRTDSPLFPVTPWFSLPMNAPSEADVRTSSAIGIADGTTAAPARFALAPSAPNPFRQATVLSYTLPADGERRLTIYDVTGRQVAVLESGPAERGSHAARWDGRDLRGRRLPAGIYLARLDHGGRIATQKLVLAPTGR